MEERIYERFTNDLRDCLSDDAVWNMRKRERIVKAYRKVLFRGISDNVVALIASELQSEKRAAYSIPVQEPGPTFNPNRLEALAERAGWTVKDGPIPGVWDNRQAGERCLWSVRWQVGNGTIDPLEMGDVDLMPYEYIRAELADVAGRGDPEAAKLLQKLEEEGDAWLNAARPYLQQKARPQYKEYVAPWLPFDPGLFMYHWRPGWPKPEWAIKPEPVMEG